MSYFPKPTEVPIKEGFKSVNPQGQGNRKERRKQWVKGVIFWGGGGRQEGDRNKESDRRDINVHT